MRTDADIKRDVEIELRWNPDVDATDIGVAVKDGVVTLTGFAKSYGEKWEAEETAKRVYGVAGVANDIEVRLPQADRRPDPEIARDAVNAIKAQLPTTAERIKVTVQNGWITLEGQVEWQFQRSLAEHAVNRIKGVNGVYNSIEVKPTAPPPADIKRKIEEALKRSAEVEASKIAVEVNDGEVTLKGTVHSWAERNEAERAAWQAPGVTKVNNKLNVRLLETL